MQDCTRAEDEDLLKELKGEYMYLACIAFVKEVKAGVPFSETSPMLNDISQVPNWKKVTGGMLKMYEGEVLSKLPVVQHMRFGTLFKCDWTPSKAAKTSVVHHT